MAAILLLFNKERILLPGNESWSGLLIAMCLLAVFVSFLSDQIFRKFIPSLVKIWIVELALISFTIILLIILKVSFVN